MNVQKTGLLTASFFMLTAVVLGAFGAHGLKAVLPTESITVFKTGVFYQFIHALALFICVFLIRLYHIKALKWSVLLFVLGILFFSGSIYLLATKSYTGIEWSFLGPITPLGGLCFIFAWFNMIVQIGRSNFS